MQYVSLTTDIWSSDINSDSLLSLTTRVHNTLLHYELLDVTAHWLDDN